MMPKYGDAISDKFPGGAHLRLTRCFVPGPLAANAERALPAAAATHLTRVLRLRVGAALRVFDGSGGEFDALVIAIGRRGEVRVRLGAHLTADRESPLRVLLLQCLVRGERMDWLVQKCTELGVAEILPVSSRHGVVQLDTAGALRRREHWAGIAVAACEQSGRNRLPLIHEVQPLDAACRMLAGRQVPSAARLLLDPQGSQSLLQAARAAAGQPGPQVALLIGPEGGFSEEELLLAAQNRFQSCTLGPRVLRAETAPLAALACLQGLLGDMA